MGTQETEVGANSEMGVDPEISSTANRPRKSRVRCLYTTNSYGRELRVQAGFSKLSIDVRDKEMTLYMSVALKRARQKVTRTDEYLLQVAIHYRQPYAGQGECAKDGIVVGAVVV
jgi:hypothetical protein